MKLNRLFEFFGTRTQPAPFSVRTAIAVGIFLLCISFTHADIKSSTGNVGFDSNADGTNELTLGTAGLGLGTSSPSTNLHVLGNAYVTVNVGVATASPGSTLEIAGSLGFSTQSVSSNTTLSGNSVIVVNSSSANVQVTLPYAGNSSGRIYTIKKTTNSNSVWVLGGGNLLDGNTALELTSATTGYPFADLISDGRQWYALKQSASGVGEVGSASGNLIGWWKLDETSGTSASDSSGNGMTGTLTGAGFTFSANTTTGKIGKALVFAGSKYITIPTINPYPNGFSFTAWFKTSSTADQEIIANKNNDFWTLRYSGATWGGVNFVVYVNSTYYQAYSANANASANGNWHFAVGTYDNETARCYVDAVEASNSPNTSPSGLITNSSQGAYIGIHSNGSSNPFVGSLDDIRIYNRVLTPAEILALYNAAN